MRRHNYLTYTLMGLVLAILAFMVSSVDNSTPAPVPAPVTTVSGCTTSISFRIEEDGSIVSWCNEEVTK